MENLYSKLCKQLKKEHEEKTQRTLQKIQERLDKLQELGTELKQKQDKLQNILDEIEEKKNSGLPKIPNFIGLVLGDRHITIPKTQFMLFHNSIFFHMVCFFPQKNKNYRYHLNVSYEIFGVLETFFANKKAEDKWDDLLVSWGLVDTGDIDDAFDTSWCYLVPETLHQEQFCLKTQAYVSFQKEKTELSLKRFNSFDGICKELLKDDLIVLHVLGKHFHISKQKILDQGNTFFSKLIEYPEDNTEEYCTNTNPDHFDLIHHFLIVGKVDQYLKQEFHNLTFIEKQSVLSDINYYGLQDMEENLDTFDKSRIVKNNKNTAALTALYPFAKCTHIYKKILENKMDVESPLWIFIEDSIIYTVKFDGFWSTIYQEKQQGWTIQNISTREQKTYSFDEICKMLYSAYNDDNLELYIEYKEM